MLVLMLMLMFSWLIYSQCLKVQSSSGQLPIGSKVYKLPKLKDKRKILQIKNLVESYPCSAHFTLVLLVLLVMSDEEEVLWKSIRVIWLVNKYWSRVFAISIKEICNHTVWYFNCFQDSWSQRAAGLMSMFFFFFFQLSPTFETISYPTAQKVYEKLEKLYLWLSFTIFTHLCLDQTCGLDWK